MVKNERVIQGGAEILDEAAASVPQHVGGVSLQEAMRETISLPELSTERQATFIDRDPSKTYGMFCSDDRHATPESAAELGEKYEIDAEAFYRTYGGATGTARRLAIAIVVQYGPEALANYGSSFVNFVGEVKQRVEANNKVKLGSHSADGNEGNPSGLNLDSDNSIGCAYCGGVGAVTCLCQPQGPLTDLAKSEQTMLFGDDSLVEPVADANLAVQDQFFADEKEAFSVGRQDVTDLALPVMILGGTHAKAADVEVALNFHADRISQPRLANEQGIPTYVIDAAAEAEMLIKAFPELKLRPAIILAAIDHDARAVREALAAHEGLHADSMKLVRYGSPAEAISYLESLQI